MPGWIKKIVKSHVVLISVLILLLITLNVLYWIGWFAFDNGKWIKSSSSCGLFTLLGLRVMGRLRYVLDCWEMEECSSCCNVSMGNYLGTEVQEVLVSSCEDFSFREERPLFRWGRKLWKKNANFLTADQGNQGQILYWASFLFGSSPFQLNPCLCTH